MRIGAVFRVFADVSPGIGRQNSLLSLVKQLYVVSQSRDAFLDILALRFSVAPGFAKH